MFYYLLVVWETSWSEEPHYRYTYHVSCSATLFCFLFARSLTPGFYRESESSPITPLHVLFTVRNVSPLLRRKPLRGWTRGESDVNLSSRQECNVAYPRILRSCCIISFLLSRLQHFLHSHTTSAAVCRIQLTLLLIMLLMKLRHSSSH